MTGSVSSCISPSVCQQKVHYPTLNQWMSRYLHISELHGPHSRTVLDRVLEIAQIQEHEGASPGIVCEGVAIGVGQAPAQVEANKGSSRLLAAMEETWESALPIH